jgi:subtilisin family serine protease
MPLPRWHNVLGMLCLLLCASVAALQVASAAPSPQGPPIPPEIARKIEPALLKQLASQKGGLIPFIAHLQDRATIPLAGSGQLVQRAALVGALQDTANRSQAGVRALLAARQSLGRAAEVRPLWIVNAIAAKADLATILELAARPEIALLRADHIRRLIDDVVVTRDQDAALSSGTSPPNSAWPSLPLGLSPIALQSALPDAVPPTVEWNIRQIGADRVWNALNIDGTGVVVATLDTGVDWQHPALQTKYRGYHGAGPPIHTGNWFDASGSGYQYPGDGHGHGTHTMGTILGGTPDHAIGVAPGARWIAVKIFTNAGYATDSGIHAGFQWIVAPAGDPSLAPDIVSNSWGTDNGFDTTFLDDVRTVRAAGILPVFANGNNGGQGAGSVGSPASFAEAFAVGATDQNDAVAAFSSRGPSPLTGAVKPDVSAPGVNVTSSFPGGGYASLNGTSMATPHVAGVAALLKQARPSITLSETMFVITSTAVPLTVTLPSNDSGWGRVDAYAATLRVTASGLLSGTITSAGAPVVGAQIVASDRSSRTTSAGSDLNGRYQLPLSADLYSVSVYGFGLAPLLNNALSISASQTTVFNADLAALPTGTVRGRITESGTGVALSATLAVQNTPAASATDPTGFYSMTLPVGAYILRATGAMHRAVTATVTLLADGVITRNFELPAAPSILLVDSGAWYYESEIGYYQAALDSLGYPYQIHTVSSPLSAVPTLSELKNYSITVWSSPQDSPDYIGAGSTLTQYLDQGGRLFLSGQDVAFWDGGGPLLAGYDYFPHRLYGGFVADSVSSSLALGTQGEALQGITLTINYSDSARNQSSLDQVIPLSDNARPFAIYQHGETAGLVDSTCLPYRAAYIGFGLEGAGPAAARQQTLQSIVDWLMAPTPEHAFALSGDDSIAIGLPGQVVTHALTLRNTGQLSDSYTLELTANQWPTTLWTGDFAHRLASPVALASCGTQTIGIQTTIPVTASRDISDFASLNVQSLAVTGLSLTRTVFSKTPAPVLLVDDDRWYEQEAHYINALNARGLSFDLFDTHGGAGPPTGRMHMYPVVVWFSGYDWFDPLSASDEQSLAAYLDAGGHLFYTAQDYLDRRFGKSSFASDYLGVSDYTNDVTVTVASGVFGNPISDGLGPYPLVFPYFNWSDYVTPTIGTATVFIGNGTAPSGISTYNPISNTKTVFFAFPFETINDNQEPTVLNNIVGWLSPFGDSGISAPAAVAPDSIYTYGLNVSSSNLDFASRAEVTVTLPASVTLLALGAPALTFDASAHSVKWAGTLTTPLTLTWTVHLDPQLVPGAWLNATALVRDKDENITFSRMTRTLVTNHWLYVPLIRR